MNLPPCQQNAQVKPRQLSEKEASCPLSRNPESTLHDGNEKLSQDADGDGSALLLDDTHGIPPPRIIYLFFGGFVGGGEGGEYPLPGFGRRGGFGGAYPLPPDSFGGIKVGRLLFGGALGV